MFATLFRHPKHVARHRDGPAAGARARYLIHCANYGAARTTLVGLASRLLAIAQRIDVSSGRTITLREVEVAGQCWARHRRRPRHLRGQRSPFQVFFQVATDWLRFLGCLEEPSDEPSPFAAQLDEFSTYQDNERGLSPATIRTQHVLLEDFLIPLIASKGSLARITIDDIDSFLRLKGEQGCCRLTIRTKAAVLRSFFRHAETRKWCSRGIAAAIEAPRVFQHEALPSGPNWQDVRRLIDSTGGPGDGDVRDRAILMLLATYGLRSGEVRGLRLGDLDWACETITVGRPKQRCSHIYPLVTAVGEAILQYLQQVRPSCAHRELFLTLRAPLRPLSQTCVYNLVSKRISSLDIQMRHRGPHSLRHASAIHLVAEGFSLKQIGDHLGHRNANATRTYAKVDLPGLREVADFDLRGLS
jgi:integrase/recombinase XerD